MDFLYMPKTATLSYPITKQPVRILEFQYFYSVLQKNSVGPDKNGKSAPSPLSFAKPRQAYGLRQRVR